MRIEQEVEHTSVLYSIGVRCQKSNQQVRNAERGECHQTSSGWPKGRGDLLRKTIGYSGQG